MDRLIAKLGAALLAIAALSGILPGGASPVFAQSPTGWQASDDDKWLFEVRDGKFSLGEGVGGYQTDRGVCVDMADMIMALDLPVRLDKKSRRATGWVFQEGRTLTIDRDSGKVEIASKAETLAPGTIYDTPEGWCVETKALSRWLGAELKVDLANSSLSVVSERKLPFQLAAERRARAQSIRTSDSFDLSTLPQASRPYKIWQTPSVDVIASAAYGNGATASRVQARWDVLASGEVAGASFDARAFSDDKGKPAGLRLRAYRSDPAGGLLGPLGATYAAIGDVSSPATALSANSGAGRGAAITNRPLDQPESFDRTDFAESCRRAGRQNFTTMARCWVSLGPIRQDAMNFWISHCISAPTCSKWWSTARRGRSGARHVRSRSGQARCLPATPGIGRASSRPGMI